MAANRTRANNLGSGADPSAIANLVLVSICPLASPRYTPTPISVSNNNSCSSVGVGVSKDAYIGPTDTAT